MKPREIVVDPARMTYVPEDTDTILWRVQHALRHTTHEHAALEIACLGYTALIDRADEFVTDFKCTRRSTLLWLAGQCDLMRVILDILGNDKNSKRSLRQLRQFAEKHGEEHIIDMLEKREYEYLVPPKDILVKLILKVEERLVEKIKVAGSEDAMYQQMVEECGDPFTPHDGLDWEANAPIVD